MKKVILNHQDTDLVLLDEVSEGTPIFAKKGGVIQGMIVNETNAESSNRWIIRLGGAYGCNGFHESREKCIKSGLSFDYEFFIN